MPERIVPYLRGLVQGVRVSATSLQRQLGLSHDQLTRTLQKKCCWEQIIRFCIQRLFGVFNGGFLILDDTVIAKPYAKRMEDASYVYSSVLETTVYGYNLVFACWSNGIVTIPISWRWVQQNKQEI